MKYTLLFLILIYTKGCDSQKNLSEDFNGNWKITTINNEKIANVDITKCTINIENSTITMSVGCNNHNGDLKMIENKIQISNVYATEMYCDKLAALEKKIKQSLPMVSDYKLEKDKLLLLNIEGDTVISLIR